MIVTIDGPAGAGKSYAARALAGRLGFRFLDTGATYRAVAFAAQCRGVDFNNEQALAELSSDIDIELTESQVLVDGEDVTDEIRTSAVTSVIHFVADNKRVRENLVSLQRQIVANDNVVTEGRDQGTVAFPHAECKIFLTASNEERARRRWLDLQERGEQVPFEEVLAQQNVRDRQDESRKVGRLVKADGAIEVSTDGMTPDQVVDRLEEIVRSKQITE